MNMAAIYIAIPGSLPVGARFRPAASLAKEYMRFGISATGVLERAKRTSIQEG